MMSNFNNQGFTGQGFNNQVARIQQNTINGNTTNPLGTGFGAQGMMNQGNTYQAQNFGGQTQVNSQVIDRIHQNSLFQGASQFDSPEIARIQQASLFRGLSQPEGQTSFSNPLNVAATQGMNQGFTNQAQGFGALPNGGNQNQQGFATQGFNQGFTNQAQGFGQNFGGQQQVNAQVIDRIHQNSLFQGGSQLDSPEIARIHQASLFQGGSQPEGQAFAGNPLNVGMTQGFNQGFTNQVQGFGQTTQGFGTLPNGGNQNQQGFATQGFNQGFTNQAQGFGQGFGGQQQVNAQVIDRIHQNSLFQGGSQLDSPEVARIHQASLFQGGSQPEGQAFGGSPLNVGMTQGMGQGFTNQVQGFGQTTQGFGALPNGGNQNQQGFASQGFNPGFTNQAQGFGQNFGGQQVSSQVIDRIHQNSLFNGGSQFDNAQVGRIQQNTINGNTANPLSTGLGGASMMAQGFGQQQPFGGNQGMNQSTFRTIMNADAGIRENEGPSSYPASMYTGQNQYDTVNQSVFNQMVGRQF